MEKHVRLSCLLGLYGELLTARQRELLSLSVDEDLSLSEIAQREGISRQGVRDALERGANQLETLETKLGLWKLQQGLWELRDCQDIETVRRRVDALLAMYEEE